MTFCDETDSLPTGARRDESFFQSIFIFHKLNTHTLGKISWLKEISYFIRDLFMQVKMVF